ncbi:MAG: ATP-binding domain-containing protein [Candidatus Delongbacteria bacterium]|nr:ATP-binding domain-containing protein [Candidatus Delongbacteria bacterium]
MAEYQFSLPSLLLLSDTQNAAINDENAIALSGGPGTGKSVVSLYRHITNHTKENKTESQLLTYTTSLALYLRACCKSQSVIASENVDSSKYWKFHKAAMKDEIIHDEAQDLPIGFNEWLKNFSTQISYGADDQQLITAQAKNEDGTYNFDKCSPEKELLRIFPNNSLHRLDTNYRNSRKILHFAKQIFTNASIPKELIESCKDDEESSFPRLLISNGSPEKQNKAIIDIIGQFHSDEALNIGVLVPFKRNVDDFYTLIKSTYSDCTFYYENQEKFPKGCQGINNLHVTTFKSSKGLEFDVVILPNFHCYNATFNVVDWRDFYVGVTRTKRNLFLISNSDLPVASEGVNKVIDKIPL